MGLGFESLAVHHNIVNNLRNEVFILYKLLYNHSGDNMIYICIAIFLLALTLILIKKLKKSKKKLIIIIFLLILTVTFSILGYLKEIKNENCCECRDCKECDICCDCKYPYYHKR